MAHAWHGRRSARASAVSPLIWTCRSYSGTTFHDDKRRQVDAAAPRSSPRIAVARVPPSVHRFRPSSARQGGSARAQRARTHPVFHHAPVAVRLRPERARAAERPAEGNSTYAGCSQAANSNGTAICRRRAAPKAAHCRAAAGGVGRRVTIWDPS